jgi:predicted TIM-barrel fold metal-dependent hydrolase
MTADENRLLIDVDVHHQYESIDALAPYLSKREMERAYLPSGGGRSTNPRGVMRKDVITPGGKPAGSVPETMIEGHLDRYGIDLALLNPGVLSLGGIPFTDLAVSLARATNDWTAAEWLPVDERFIASIIVAPQDPAAAAAEIRRQAENPRMVQVSMTSAPCLMGDRFMHPIYEAADEFNLPVNLHVGGATKGVSLGDYPVGQGASFFETHIGMCIPAIYHVISMVAEGVFVKFANTRLVLNEFGLAWLPFVMWRLDMEYRASRIDIPWLTEMPSDHLRKHLRFSTQPLETPEDPQKMISLLDLVDAEEMLLFASDYPHWDFDSPELALKGFPADWKRKITCDNAFDVYHLEERLGIQRQQPALV